MNEKLSRTAFDQLETTEKQALMESLAARYDMVFLGLHTFDRWGQSCTTGLFKKENRAFVLVPGDTITLECVLKPEAGVQNAKVVNIRT